MKYYGESAHINASFIVAHKDLWNILIPIYKEEIENKKYSNYAHDEETLLYNIWKNPNHKKLFQLIQ